MKIQKILFGFGILATTLLSCNKKDVQLPKASQTMIKDLVDHSPVYLFFDTNGTDTLVEVNRKNTISSTNWVFNIDKRLPLKLVIPEVMQLQEKKKSSSHNREDSMTLFSYADSIGSNLAFMPFTDVTYQFETEKSQAFIKKNAALYATTNAISVEFHKNNQLKIDGKWLTKTDFTTFLKNYETLVSEENKIVLHLNFDSQLLFQDYIQYKVFAWQLTNSKVQLSSYEFVFDANNP